MATKYARRLAQQDAAAGGMRYARARVGKLPVRIASGNSSSGKFFKICEFVNHGDHKRFQAAALEAIHRLAGEAGQ